MGLFKRATEIAEAKVNKLLNQLEDPRETLDLSYEKMLSGLQEVKAHVADVVTEQKSLERQIGVAQEQVEDYEKSAKAALKMDREDLATQALERKQTALAHLQELKEAHERITVQVDRLKDAERKYQERIDSFRVQKEITKASYTAAKSEVKIGESMGGISKQLGNIGDTMKRAEDKTNEMLDRSVALQSLADEGILDDPFDKRDKTTRELDKIRQDADVQDDLERLKRELDNE